MSFEYAASKFSTARRNLMLPFPAGEAQSIAHAFHECHLGLKDIQEDQLDDNSRSWHRELLDLMSTEGLEDPAGEGLWAVKAKTLSEGDLFRLSSVVDDLQYWFREKARAE